MKAKRILSIALVLCLCLTMIPAMAMQAEAAAYDNTHTNTGNQAYDIVAVAQTQIGYQEGTNNYNKYSAEFGVNNVEWCAYFVSWCAKKAGISDSIIHRQGIASPFSGYFNIPNTHSNGNYFPKPGDLVFYGPNSKGDHYHVGIVETVNPSTGYITTIEGNTNSSGSSTGYTVCRHTRHYQHSTICCYGTPKYTNTSIKHTVDSRYSAYFPIAAYPISTGHISVYDASGTIYSNRYIDGATDICIIWEIYTDGWCKVRYPSSAETSGYFDAYVPLPVFTSASAPSSWVAENNYTTYKRSDMESSMHSISSGANGLLLKTDGYLKQIIHPVSGQSYYMMGWIAEPKQIHSSTTSFTLTLGGTSSQTIYAWSTGYYDGNTALYYSRSNSNISCSWGDWADGKAPLTITAISAGTTTLTLGVKDSNTDTILDSMTVIITVGAKAYTVSYNANGGSGAPGSQTKYHNTTLTLSNTKPTRTGYTFLGWSTSSTATSASYQPGGSFTINDNITLYAVWKNGCEGNTHKYVYNITGRPTSTSTGKIVGECGYCGATTSVLLPKLNTNDYTYKVTKAATCTATGMGRYTWNTTTYGGSYYFDETIPSTGHSYSYKATKTPTTSATGTLTGTCSKCSGTTTITLPKLNTTAYSYSVTKAATCTATGTGRYTWKTITYGSFYFDLTIPATGHTYTNKVTAPTCTTQGYTTHTCSCGYSYKDTYTSATGHNYSNGDCTRCGADDPNYIPGDIDGNGEVNRDDVVQLLLHVSMPTAFPIDAPADFDGDGMVTRDDVIQLLLHVSMPDAFPL